MPPSGGGSRLVIGRGVNCVVTLTIAADSTDFGFESEAPWILHELAVPRAACRFDNSVPFMVLILMIGGFKKVLL